MSKESHKMMHQFVSDLQSDVVRDNLVNRGVGAPLSKRGCNVRVFIMGHLGIGQFSLFISFKSNSVIYLL